MRVVIVNPASAGGRTADRWQGIVNQIEQYCGPCDVLLTQASGHAIELTRSAVEAGARELVVLGGDGTVGEVVAGCLHPDGSRMLEQQLTLSIVHQGTGGDLVRSLGIPREAAAAVAVAAHGERRAIDVGVARFTPIDGAASTSVRGFVNCANIGLAAEVVEQVTGRLKRLGKNGAFAAATLRGLARNRRRTVTVTTDEGTTFTTDVVDLVASNGRYMGGGMLVAPDARIDDGRFDLVTIGAASRARLLRAFPRIYRGTHVTHPLVSIERTRACTVTAGPDGDSEGLVLDGELVGRTPARLEVLPAAMLVRVPAAHL